MSGGTLTDAANAISSYPKAIRRYASEHPVFGDAMERARAEGDRRAIIADGTADLADDFVPVDAHPPPEYVGVPGSHTVEASEIMAVDVDLVTAVDASLPVVPGLPRMSAMSVLAFQWKTMHDNKQPPLLRKACNDVVTSYVLGPAMAAQQRRNERAQRLELSESTIIDAESVDTGGSGLEIIEAAGTVLEIPANGSEAPGHAPTPRDEAHP